MNISKKERVTLLLIIDLIEGLFVLHIHVLDFFEEIAENSDILLNMTFRN
jgi:hypothetical protein